MNTNQKEQKSLKNQIQKAMLVRAMTEAITSLSTDNVKIPTKYRDQVLAVKESLKKDSSGLVNSLLDFAISCANVEYSVETDNEKLTEIFNNWLSSINEDLLGKIPTGINALAKEYFKERWKGSSFIILRTLWEERNGVRVPVKMWFVNGEDIIIQDDNESFSIGSESYSLKISKKDVKKLPSIKDEIIFIQKPFESWGSSYPTPFLIKRGVFKNLAFLELLSSKGDFIIGKALEYLFLLKKGNADLALSGQSDFIYSDEDMESIKTKLSELLVNRKSTSGVPTYATGFDTEISHIIPEYEKALKQELFTPTERRLLAGLGMIDVLQGIASTRKESMLNPKPFVAEVEQGIEDFKSIMFDVMKTIIKENLRLFTNAKVNIQKIHSTPISEFISDDFRKQLTEMYDRGVISKQTYVEVAGERDFFVEMARRSYEKDEIDDVMYPPVIENEEQYVKAEEVKSIEKEEKNIESNNLTLNNIPDEIKNLNFSSDVKNLYIVSYNQVANKGKEYASKVAMKVVKRFYKKIGGEWVSKKQLNSQINNAIPELVKSAELDIQLKQAQLDLAKKFLNGEE